MVEGLGLLGIRKEAGYKRIYNDLASRLSQFGDVGRELLPSAADLKYKQSLADALYKRSKKIATKQLDWLDNREFIKGRKNRRLTGQLYSFEEDPVRFSPLLENLQNHRMFARRQAIKKLLDDAKGDIGKLTDPKLQSVLSGHDEGTELTDLLMDRGFNKQYDNIVRANKNSLEAPIYPGTLWENETAISKSIRRHAKKAK